MEQSKQNTRKQSHYARKRANPSGMMYGPGCCAHAVTQSQIDRAKAEARERERRDV